MEWRRADGGGERGALLQEDAGVAERDLQVGVRRACEA